MNQKQVKRINNFLKELGVSKEHPDYKRMKKRLKITYGRILRHDKLL